MIQQIQERLKKAQESAAAEFERLTKFIQECEQKLAAARADLNYFRGAHDQAAGLVAAIDAQAEPAAAAQPAESAAPAPAAAPEPAAPTPSA